MTWLFYSEILILLANFVICLFDFVSYKQADGYLKALISLIMEKDIIMETVELKSQ